LTDRLPGGLNSFTWNGIDISSAIASKHSTGPAIFIRRALEHWHPMTDD
jgi:hypothetical protein